MAHFRGTIQGQRGQASRLGSKRTGFDAHIASWQGCVDVYLSADENGVDHARVTLSPHHGVGTDRVLYDGPISGKKK